jgi:hypothetical protein
MATQPHYKTPCNTITSLATIENDQGGIGNNEVPLIINFFYLNKTIQKQNL